MNELPVTPSPAPPVECSCEWCGERPAEVYEVEPPIIQRIDGVPFTKKRAVEAWACKTHRERFDRQRREREERRKAKR